LLAEAIWTEISIIIGLYHPLDGISNPKYKQLPFLTNEFFYKKKKIQAFNRKRCCHLALCLWLILFIASPINSMSVC
jgi:hypothetical protein